MARKGNVTGPFNIGVTTPHPTACKNCVFMQVAPDASFCAMYPDDQESKPDDVYFYGKECIFRRSKSDDSLKDIVEIARPEDT